jgi:ankyrin repeat protein
MFSRCLQDGWTALIYAASVGNAEATEILLNANADANIQLSVSLQVWVRVTTLKF